jgi:putative ABC transport system permease protein
MGVRMALGAAPVHVLAMVLREGGLLAVGGIVIGGGAAFALARYLGVLLAGSNPTDPVTYTAVALFAILLTAIASYIPARRAARIDPLAALRNE